MQKELLAILSQLSHLIIFRSAKQGTKHENGVFVISIDVDVGSSQIGLKNKGSNDANVHDYLSEYEIGKREEQSIPLLLELFDNLEVPATFAVRGQLTEIDSSVLELIKESSVKHDIGAHGYYHRTFTSLSEMEAEKELKMIRAGMKQFNIEPRTFIFPKNNVAHLSLLEKYGYKCYRGCGGLGRDRLCVERHGQLYDICPSFFLGWSDRVVFLNKIIDISAKNKLTFHVWLHPHDLGDSQTTIQKRIARVLLPLLKYAKRKEQECVLNFETMYSLASKLAEMDRC